MCISVTGGRWSNLGRYVQCLNTQRNAHTLANKRPSDTSTRLPITRLKQVLAGNNITNAGGSPKQDRLAEENVLDRLQHYHVPTLAHLIVLLLQSAPKFPGANTRLIVVDSLSALIDITYPRGTGDLAAAKQSEHARWLSGRRQAIVSDITGKLSKLAAVNNIAILVTNYATTKIRAGARAVIRPALTGSDWEKALGAGIILLRGWWPERGGKGKESDQRASRLAGVVKGCNGTSIERGAVDLALSFDIEEVRLRIRVDPYHRLTIIKQHGVKEISPAEEHQMLTQKHTAEVGSAKRPYAAIADSDRDDSGSEYGWADDDQIAAEGLVDDVVLVDSVSTEMAGTIAVPTLEIKDNDQSKT